MTDRDTLTDDRQVEWDQLGRKHIFAVNSDPVFLDLVRTLLQGESYNVTTTNHVPRTFNQIVALRPDLIIINLTPREFSGWNLLERLYGEALTHQIPMIVTSTNPQFLDHARRNSELYGERRYIVLPLDLDVLLRTIHSLIGVADPERNPESPDEP